MAELSRPPHKAKCGATPDVVCSNPERPAGICGPFAFPRQHSHESSLVLCWPRRVPSKTKGEAFMRLDRQEIEATLSLLLDEMEGEQGRSHEIYLRLVQILDAMRATGMPLPEDLVAMERDMGAEFEGETEEMRERSKTQSSPKTQSDLKRSK